MTARPTLADLYAMIPGVACRGLCWTACGPVPSSPAERRAVKAATGIDLPVDAVQAARVGEATGMGFTCPALSAFHTCRVHETRPAVCRAYGVAEGLPCPYGCVPDRVLSDVDTYAILRATFEATE